MANAKEKRAAFVQRIKVNSSDQSKAAKQSQFCSNNKKSSSGNKANAPDRQRSLTTGRGNER